MQIRIRELQDMAYRYKDLGEQLVKYKAERCRMATFYVDPFASVPVLIIEYPVPHSNRVTLRRVLPIPSNPLWEYVKPPLDEVVDEILGIVGKLP